MLHYNCFNNITSRWTHSYYRALMFWFWRQNLPCFIFSFVFITEFLWCTSQKYRWRVFMLITMPQKGMAYDPNFCSIFIRDSYEHSHCFGFSTDKSFGIINWINPNANIIDLIFLIEFDLFWQFDMRQCFVVCQYLALIINLFLPNNL